MKITTILGRDPLTSSGVMDSIALASVAIETEREIENTLRMIDEVNNGKGAPERNGCGQCSESRMSDSTHSIAFAIGNRK
jgi:hypothetical protein